MLAATIRRTDWFGQKVTFTPETDVPLAYAKNNDEFLALLRFLVQREFIENPRHETQNWPPTISVTASGMEHDRLRTVANVESKTVFVAMRFSDEMNSVYETAIDPAIRDCGFDPNRVDLEEHNDQVIDRMFALIRESRFVVSDFTEHRNGVYFEAGFASGLGLPVIWCCHGDQMRDSHFDTNHFNHVTWSDAEELRKKLETRILATIGRGPQKASGKA